MESREMGMLSIIAMAGNKWDLNVVCRFPPEVQWDKIVRVETPADHGSFPDLSGYEAEDFADLESSAEDGALYEYMQKCVDAVLDFVNHKAESLAALNYQDIESTITGMNTGGDVFAVVGFVKYQPKVIGNA